VYAVSFYTAMNAHVDLHCKWSVCIAKYYQYPAVTCVFRLWPWTSVSVEWTSLQRIYEYCKLYYYHRPRED